MCQKSTAHEQRRSRGESRKLRFGSNRTAPKIWQERQHDLHSPPQPIEVDENTPLEQSTIETCLQEAYKYSTRKLRKFPVTSGQGSKHRDWTASRWWARWRSQSSSCQHHVITWRGQTRADSPLITNILIQSRDLAMIARWHQCGTMTSQMLARASFSAVCLTVFPFEFRTRTFTIGFYGKNSIISELMILESSFPLKKCSKLSFARKFDTLILLVWTDLKNVCLQLLWI